MHLIHISWTYIHTYLQTNTVQIEELKIALTNDRILWQIFSNAWKISDHITLFYGNWYILWTPHTHKWLIYMHAYIKDSLPRVHQTSFASVKCANNYYYIKYKLCNISVITKIKLPINWNISNLHWKLPYGMYSSLNATSRICGMQSHIQTDEVMITSIITNILAWNHYQNTSVTFYRSKKTTLMLLFVFMYHVILYLFYNYSKL